MTPRLSALNLQNCPEYEKVEQRIAAIIQDTRDRIETASSFEEVRYLIGYKDALQRVLDLPKELFRDDRLEVRHAS